MYNHPPFAKAPPSRWHGAWSPSQSQWRYFFASQSHLALYAIFPACNNGYIFLPLVFCVLLIHICSLFCLVCFIFNGKVVLVSHWKILDIYKGGPRIKKINKLKKKTIPCWTSGLAKQISRRDTRARSATTSTKRESTRAAHAWSRLTLWAATPPILQAQECLTALSFHTNLSSQPKVRARRKKSLPCKFKTQLQWEKASLRCPAVVCYLQYSNLQHMDRELSDGILTRASISVYLSGPDICWPLMILVSFDL